VDALPTGDGPDDDERLVPGRDGVREWGVARFVGEILFAGEEAQKRPALLRDLVADSAAQHRIPGLESIKYRALRNRAFDVELHFAAHVRQRSKVLRDCDSDHIELMNATGTFFRPSLGVERATNLPVMPERINHPPQSPAVLLPYGEDLRRAGRPGLDEDSIRIGYSQDYSNRAATKRLGTEVAMLRRLVTQPKLRALNGKPCHHASAGVFEAKDLSRSECGLVEVDGSGTIANR